MSGIGKGITASSIGVVLKTQGLRVSAIKIDPYLNLDSGTMSPFEHGECYVLDDGGETDLDLGNYERFCDLSLTRNHNITTGKIYSKVIQAERNGDYLGKTVQVVPHITDAIQEWIEETARIPVDGSDQEPDVCLIELGGTIGDMESDSYVEALRQLGFRLGQENIFYVNVCYCPVLGVTEEIKTKPAQNGIREVRSHGINPDLLIVRCEAKGEIDSNTIDKLSNICQIPGEQILLNRNVNNIYQIPLVFRESNLFSMIDRKLKFRTNLEPDQALIERWTGMATLMASDELLSVKVGVIGKYTGMIDSYLSLSHAVRDAGLKVGKRTQLCFVEASELEGLTDSAIEERLKEYEYLLIPGGFGQRGIEGMINAAKYARINQVPCLGICLGFQVMVIEFTRNVLGLKNASSSEFDSECVDPVITIMNEDQKVMGGTMRLGSQVTRLAKLSKAWECYGGEMTEVHERHRHRYEVNPDYLEKFDQSDLWFSGVSQDGKRMEILELNRTEEVKSFYLGTQFHGEYLTRPGKAHPIFVGWLQ